MEPAAVAAFFAAEIAEPDGRLFNVRAGVSRDVHGVKVIIVLPKVVSNAHIPTRWKCSICRTDSEGRWLLLDGRGPGVVH
jgi:hypothetical protein